MVRSFPLIAWLNTMTGLLTFRVLAKRTAQPRNRATAQPRNSAGNSFAQRSLLPSLPDNPRRLPRLFRRCPGFDNDCPEFWWGERPREPRCPESKTSRPDFVNVCPDIDSRLPRFSNHLPRIDEPLPRRFPALPRISDPCPVFESCCPDL